jgi:hypothetical protein
MNNFSRSAIIIFILGALLLIPFLITNIMSHVMNKISPYLFSFHITPDEHFICIAGNIPFASVFIEELFIELNRTKEQRGIIVVLLSPLPPSADLSRLLHNIKYRYIYIPM